MMNRISGRQALAAGFGVIGREPGAFLVWCVVCFALGVAPQILTIGPTLAMLGAMAEGGGAANPEVAAAQADVLRFQPITYLCSLAVMLLVPPAIFRAVLFPDERGVMYLRVGAREFWMTLIVIVLVVMYVLALLVGMIPFLIVAAIGGAIAGVAGGGSAGAALLGFVLMAILIGAVIWGLLRFSMAPIMAFAQSTFRLTESWGLTRGHVWKMFLVALTLFVLTLIVELVVFGVFAAWAGAVVPLSSFAKDPQGALNALGVPFLAAGGIAFSLMSGAAYTIWGGAWAEMYRQISEKPADVFA
jgi:hypothetical protein